MNTHVSSVSALALCRSSSPLVCTPAGEEERLRALRLLGVVKQPVGHQFGSITRWGDLGGMPSR